MAGEVFREDFESGTAGTTCGTVNTAFTATGGTSLPVFDSGLVQAGLSAKFTWATSTYGYMSAPVGTLTSCYARAYLRVDTLPASGRSWVLMLRSGSTTRAIVRVGNTGKVSITNNQTMVAESTDVLSTGTVYRLEWDCAGATQTLRVYAGNATTALFTLTGATPNLAVDNIAIGSMQGGTGVFALDSVVVRDDVTPGPEAGPPPSTGSGVKVYVGGAWVLAPVKAYVGGTWKTAPVKAYIGGTWVEV